MYLKYFIFDKPKEHLFGWERQVRLKHAKIINNVFSNYNTLLKDPELG